MQPDSLTPQPQSRSWIVVGFVALLVIAVGFLLRDRSIRRQRQRWINSVQALGLQVYPLSPLFDQEPSVAGIIESLVLGGKPGVVVSDEKDLQSLIDHEGSCPWGTAFVIAPQVSSYQTERLAERYPMASITTFTALYSSKTSARTAPTRK
jgi:hypothetical protein